VSVGPDALRRSASLHHGHAGRAFLEKLSRDAQDMVGLWEQTKRAPGFVIDGAEGQDKRAIARFALIAMARELAADYKIVPWPKGTTQRSLAFRPGGNCVAPAMTNPVKFSIG